MGWIQTRGKRSASLLCALLAMVSLALASTQAQAQGGTGPYTPPGVDTKFKYFGQGYYNLPAAGTPRPGPDEFVTIDNGLLALTLGAGVNQGGSIGLWSSTINPEDDFLEPLLYYGPLVPKNKLRLLGTRVFVRVDGGINAGQNGFDYELGQPNNAYGGQWLLLPNIINNHLVARWTTYPVTYGTTGTGGGGTGGTGGGGTGGTTTGTPIDPRIEIDITLSFIHNQARFQFNVINNDIGRSHTVGLVFKQELLVNPNDGSISAPIRLPNRPYLRVESSLTGGDIPAYWESLFSGFGNASGNNSLPSIHSIRGTLRPTATSGNEPTIPSRFVLGSSSTLEGDTAPPANQGGLGAGTNLSLPGPSGRYFDDIWQFTPNPSIRFDTPGSPYGSNAIYFDEQPIAPGQTIPIIAYVGQSDCDIDVGQPIGLVVTSPTALNYTGAAGSQAFTVNAFVTNLLDLQPGGGISISPVSVTIDLPAGLKLATGETSTKAIGTISPGTEGAVSWSVVPDGTKTGLLRFTVTAAANVGTGKVVQRNVYVPNAIALDLRGNATAKGLYQMVSVPLNFNGDPITKFLFPGQDPNLVTPDVAHFNPATGKYETVTTFQLGEAYWIRSRIAQDQHVAINVDPNNSGYQTLSGQVQPTASAFKATYSRGWNQVGNPYVLPINFSEIQIFDPTTLTITNVSDAASPVNQVVLPAVYEYDTTDPNPANWHYILEPSIGFQMQPLRGYWVYVRKSNLQFLYPGVDIPGVSVGRAAMLGVGFKKKLQSSAPEVLGRGTSNNWRLKVSAKSDTGYDPDNFIGVAPNATDGLDGYKYGKPPVMNKSLSLDIMHKDWEKDGRYAHDLRSPGLATKTWDMTVTSTKPGEKVTLSWASIAHDVPRNYTLTLVDSGANQRINMRNSSGYAVTTGSDGTRSVQVIAEPAGSRNSVEISTFEVVNNAGAGRAAQSANIHFSLTGDADTQVVVRNARGQAIRTLVPTTTKAAGSGVTTGSALWDLKTQQGTTVAAGQYNMELSVKASNGRSARRTTSFLITR